MVLAALSGCTDPDEATEPDDLGPESGASPDDDVLAKGVLRGVVVDQAVRPLADAVVRITGATQSFEVTTDADGNFGVSSLDAGNYSINASLAGYEAAEVDALVVGGENNPELVQVMLVAAVTEQPFIMSIPWSAVIGCAHTGANWCAIIDIYTGIDVTNDGSGKFFYDEFMEQQRTPDYVQIEIVWEPQSVLAEDLYFRLHAGNWELWESFVVAEFYPNVTSGSSPLINSLNRAELERNNVGYDHGIGIELFPDGGGGVPFGVMVNQPFDGFLHAFYGCLPPEGWSFTTHGEATCA